MACMSGGVIADYVANIGEQGMPFKNTFGIVVFVMMAHKHI